MSPRQLKASYLVLTWLNIYAVAYYFNYLFFHLRDDFGFGSRQNLLFAASVDTAWNVREHIDFVPQG